MRDDKQITVYIFVVLATLLALVQSYTVAGDYSIALLRDKANEATVVIAEKMLPALKAKEFNAEYLTYEGLCLKGTLDQYDCLVLTDSTRFPVDARAHIQDFLKRGADLVLLGGMSFDSASDSLSNLPIFEDRDVYRFRNAPGIVTYDKQDLLKTSVHMKGSYTGISAIAFEYPDVSRYIPLLSVQDPYSRNVGFAGGLLVNHGGEYKNSQWLLFGIDGVDFYCGNEFQDVMVELLQAMRRADLPARFAAEDAANAQKTLPVISPAPSEFVTLSKDEKHFLQPDGRKFFAVGCNYIGSFERKCEFGEDYFNVSRLEEDFRKAHEAGINTFRLWNFRIENYPQRMQTIIELARKYHIYLIMTPRSHPLPTDRMLAEVFQKTAELLSDETIVLGYDLMNEPYITTIGSVRMNDKPSEILRHDVYNRYSSDYFDKAWVKKIARRRGWPELGEWIEGEDALNLFAAYSMAKQYLEKFNPPQDYSCLYGLNGVLPVEAEYKDFIAAVDTTFSDWIGFHKKAIRQFDTNHFITVGYNTSLAALPANGELDFVSHHIYQMPYSYEDMQKSVTAYDRLRAFWPDQPITLGEFGFTSGLNLKDDQYLGHCGGSVAEMTIFLYAFANDYSGACLWMLSEWPIANMKYNAPWISADRHIYESRFGLYQYDGTATGKPKPIAHAIRFFSDYIDTHEPGNGTLELVRAKTPTGAGYIFSNKDALFVGNTEYISKRLTFRSVVPVNVMASWKPNELKVMATSDVEVTMNLSEFGFADKADYKIEGICDTPVKTGSTVTLKLLEGQVVTFYF